MHELHVQAARIPDRDRLLQELTDHGLDARPVDEVGIEVPVENADGATDAVLAYVEDVVISIGAPFVPMKHDGVIYIRPPLS